MVFGESKAEAGYRRADPDWSRYTARRRYPHPSSRRPNKPKSIPGNKSFAKRISSAKRNPLSSQYPAGPGQPLGLILNVGDQRKSYQSYQRKKPTLKKPDSLKEKKLKMILKKKGPRQKVRLVRRKPLPRLSTSPQKTFRPKKGSTMHIGEERVFSEIYPSGTIGY